MLIVGPLSLSSCLPGLLLCPTAALKQRDQPTQPRRRTHRWRQYVEARRRGRRWLAPEMQAWRQEVDISKFRARLLRAPFQAWTEKLEASRRARAKAAFLVDVHRTVIALSHFRAWRRLTLQRKAVRERVSEGARARSLDLMRVSFGKWREETRLASKLARTRTRFVRSYQRGTEHAVFGAWAWHARCVAFVRRAALVHFSSP